MVVIILLQPARERNFIAREATQLRQIHTALVSHSASQNGGKFATPGLIKRLPINGIEHPGRGAENIALNTTANMYSMLVAMNYFTPELLVSPRDRNPCVRIDQDYNYDAYNPNGGTYWDALFQADLERESNVSFAHIPLHGISKAAQWKNAGDSKFVILGNRIPRGGILTADSFACTEDGHWLGHLVFGDGAVKLHAVAPPQTIDGPISFTKEMTDEGPLLQFD